MTEFPPGFAWGAATASYQVEGAVTDGGRTPSIWDTFAHTPGRIVDGQNGDVAVDHYHRFEEDVALLAELGLNAYRFSIAWPRLQPKGAGAANPEGVDFYRRLVESCQRHGITPYATLYHWDLPQPLEDSGGWLNRDTAARFADYAALAHAALGDLIDQWITLNEPWCSAFLGYASGTHAPGRREGTTAVTAAHHLLLGHGLATQAIRSHDPHATVGLTLNLYAVHAASDSVADRDAARRIDGLSNRLFLDPVLDGTYPDDVLADVGLTDWFAQRADDLATISGPIDFLGINYYSRHTLAAGEPRASTGPARSTSAGSHRASSNPGSESVRYVDTGAARTQMGWPIHPDGLVEVLRRVHDRSPELPLYVTENGAAYPDTIEPDGTIHDIDRQNYFELHVEACRQALEHGVDLRGYFAWTLMDNFEWAFGFTRRFGLVHVDFATQQRTVKDSGRWFARFLQERRSRTASD